MTKLKLFVATARGQGMRPNDFCHTIDGELLTYPFECATDRDADGPCGCQRSMSGITSHRGTTTFTVGELDLMIGDLAQLLADDVNAQCEQYIGPADMAEMTEYARQLAADAEHFDVGQLLEKRGDFIQTRSAQRRR